MQQPFILTHTQRIVNNALAFEVRRYAIKKEKPSRLSRKIYSIKSDSTPRKRT